MWGSNCKDFYLFLLNTFMLFSRNKTNPYSCPFFICNAVMGTENTRNITLKGLLPLVYWAFV